MMIFVTVGTTCFDELIGYMDVLAKHYEHQIILQTGPSTYIPSNASYFDFTNDIEAMYDKADIIVSHAGAGSTYKLLELEKPLILVPNLERVDKHQSDIATFMENNRHALVAWEYVQIPKMIDKIVQNTVVLKPFKKKAFFAQERLRSEILRSVGEES
ncbi:hypothetical protein OE749_01005 [Aestuariibacter sp. AA17]|uniref:Glycosyl transferase family 28 C-terminal domain-containing protein n=1 Tax=Fluctibacter corallii TaxID=2984329 RepID=A0ABT3A3L1_9ALTE|nr:PssE/Cps14G family polysaccharide biosynthesis glycosyltransferase [Aestuariibacter sp. AA17]MCV2883272.1 hypothetical protein [Aestuariibacter sp. AA17]